MDGNNVNDDQPGVMGETGAAAKSEEPEEARLSYRSMDIRLKKVIMLRASMEGEEEGEEEGEGSQLESRTGHQIRRRRGLKGKGRRRKSRDHK